MRNISFALTTDQVRNRTKTVTRRLGWKTLTSGTLLQPVVKGMGLGKGGKVEKIGGPIRVVDVSRAPLNRMTGHYEDFAASDEAKLEGFPHLTSEEFVAMFCEHNRCGPEDEVTRIEFVYVDDVQGAQRASSVSVPPETVEGLRGTRPEHRRMPSCQCGHSWAVHVIPGGVDNLDIYPNERWCADCSCRNYIEGAA